MAGEFRIAQNAITDALETATAEASMSPETMAQSLLTEILTHLAKQHSSSDLESMIQYQLQNLSEDAFVVTRGC